MLEERRLYTTPEAAELIGISANHMRTLIVRGTATPAKQIGGTWLFSIEEIERLRSRPNQRKRAKK